MVAKTSLGRTWFILKICFILAAKAKDQPNGQNKQNQRLDKVAEKTFIQRNSDIVFLLDRSGSVGAANFEIEKGFVESFLTHIVIDANASRLAVISYSNTAERHLDYIKEPKNKCHLVRDLEFVEYKNSGATNMGAGFLEAQDVLKNSRDDTKKVIILLSDGLSNRGVDPVSVANKLKKIGVEIFTFGIGRFFRSELEAIASSVNHSFIYPEFREFKKLAHRIRGDLYERTWSEGGTVRDCDYLCNSPYKGMPDDPGCCDHMAKCSCGLLSGTHTCACGPGYYGLDGQLGNCKACPKGTYKNSYEVASDCTACPFKATTLREGSTSIRDCSCVTGYNGDPSTGKSCTIVECPPLQAPSHGNLLRPCGNTFGSLCLFSCEKGYELRDPNSKDRICKETGIWTATETVCQRIRCKEPIAPPYGQKKCGDPDFLVGSSCTFDCKPGYILIGQKKKTCLATKVWSGQEISCEPVMCPALKFPRFGILQMCTPGKHQEFNTVCLFSCLPGFQIDSSPFLQCTKHGNWSDKIPTCRDIEPPSLKCPPSKVFSTEPKKNYAYVKLPELHASDNSDLKPKIAWSPALKFPAKFPIGTTVISFKATDSALLSFKCKTLITVKDNERPIVLSCPSTIELETDELDIEVSWSEPKFWDNSLKKLKTFSNEKSGERYPPGVTSVVYYAEDPSGNKATCKFDVIVKKNHCPFYPPPVNGALACDDWLYGQFCQVYCNENFDFITKPAEWYICESTSKWETDPLNYPVPWPDCAEWYVPSKIRKAVSGQYFAGNCSDPRVQEVIKTLFLNHFTKQFNTTQYCTSEGSCTIEKVQVKCGKVNLTLARRKRDVSKLLLDQMLEIEVEFTVSAGKNNVSSFQDLLEAVNRIVANMKTENTDEDIWQEKSVDVEPFSVVVDTPTQLLCYPGAILKNEECVQCPLGTFHNRSSDVCDFCPIGEFQDEEGQIKCKLCPEGSLTEETGTKNSTKCKERCPPGTFSLTGLETCKACPVGTYQNETQQTSCLSCPSLMTTWIEGATDILDCKEFNHCYGKPCQYGSKCISLKHSYSCECGPEMYGKHCERNVDACLQQPCAHNSTCIDLVVGFQCICQPGFTGKTCEEEIDECRVGSSMTCKNGGTCVDEVGSFKCICSPWTTGDYCEDLVDLCETQPCYFDAKCRVINFTRFCDCTEGFTGSDCSVNIDDCFGIECHNGGSCLDMVNGYKCLCSPGFIGHFCETNINDCFSHQCQNEATCKDQVDGYVCLCLPGFSGEFCETKMSENFIMTFQQPSVSNFALSNRASTMWDVTLGLWVQTNDLRRPGSMFSYATTDSNGQILANALLLTDYGSMKLYVNDEPIFTDLPVNDGKWHQLTFTWSSRHKGQWKLFENGQLVTNGTGVQTGKPIPGNGTFVIGQDQDSIGGNFSPLEAFQGNISRINVWNRILTKSEIQQLCKFKDNLPGRIKAWPDFLQNVKGNVQLRLDERPQLPQS
ncbi:sushi, von Willebrand factor type A, EGF and pentraxin domain-containing protein 1-like isoform X2 [Tachypleus tridentatus]|uniref:sushi, von Willebrand factor type A, EGF and pentraxin domain-containing protein 1-like isoform X2 n=1 Tax=Tachypleus tridentatus TaxID=6853 RepID=UPI003FD279ED